MLQPVVRNQHVFKVPSLAADGRGIAVGPTLTIVLPTLSHLVGFLRGVGRTQPLSRLLGQPRIHHGRLQGGARVIYLHCPSRGSHSADQVAAVARLHQGQVYTGDTNHAARYRDGSSTLGYDADALVSTDGQVLYDQRPRVLTPDQPLHFETLVARLTLIRDVHRTPSTVYVRAPASLGPRLLRRLTRRGARVELGLLQVGRAAEVLLRIRELPTSLLSLLQSLPRVTVFRQAHSRFFVELGRSHPLDLAACADLLPDKGWWFFAGDRGDVSKVPDGVEFESGSDFKPFKLGGADTEVALIKGHVLQGRPVTLRSITQPTAQGAMAGRLLIGAQTLDRLRRLIYLASTQVLNSIKIVTWDDHAVLLGEGAAYFPLGQPLRRASPNLLVPLHAELRPAVDEHALQALVPSGRTALLLPGGGVQWATSDAQILRRHLALILPTVEGKSLPNVYPTPQLAATEVSVFRLLLERL